jgi:hypothetical protein
MGARFVRVCLVEEMLCSICRKVPHSIQLRNDSLATRLRPKKKKKAACEPAAVTSWLSQAVSDARPPGS